MPTRRAFLTMLAGVLFLSLWSSIGSEEDSTLPDFDEANVPLEPYGDLDMAAWRPDPEQFFGQPTPEAMGEAAARGAEMLRRNPALANIAVRYRRSALEDSRVEE
jgi:hypothetical protein